MKQLKMVPVEPTRKMCEAAVNLAGEDGDHHEMLGRSYFAYKAMLAAAPSPWVSVGDRLPDAEKGSTESASVIVCLNDFVITTGFYCHFENEWYGEDGYSFEEASNGPVTHWMPLPEAPGAKERNE